jgi:hypothetical protein
VGCGPLVAVTLTLKVTAVPEWKDAPELGEVITNVGMGRVPFPMRVVSFRPLTVLPSRRKMADRGPGAVGANWNATKHV